MLQKRAMRKATTFAKPQEIQRAWHVIDADGLILGRLATRVAILLRGKHKPSYNPHWDSGDNVVVVNAVKVRLSGQKATQKMYTRYSGYPGGLKAEAFSDRLSRRPTDVVWEAVRLARKVILQGPTVDLEQAGARLEGHARVGFFTASDDHHGSFFTLRVYGTGRCDCCLCCGPA